MEREESPKFHVPLKSGVRPSNSCLKVGWSNRVGWCASEYVGAQIGPTAASSSEYDGGESPGIEEKGGCAESKLKDTCREPTGETTPEGEAIYAGGGGCAVDEEADDDDDAGEGALGADREGVSDDWVVEGGNGEEAIEMAELELEDEEGEERKKSIGGEGPQPRSIGEPTRAGAWYAPLTGASITRSASSRGDREEQADREALRRTPATLMALASSRSRFFSSRRSSWRRFFSSLDIGVYL